MVMKNRLTPKELMIGDVVMYDPNIFIEDEYEPYHRHKVYTIQDGDDIDCAIEGCYYDIPLTEEILLNNGFGKIKEYTDIDAFNIPAINLGSALYRNKANDYWLIAGHDLCLIRSVRDLQHFLRMCNVNMTFEDGYNEGFSVGGKQISDWFGSNNSQ